MEMQIKTTMRYHHTPSRMATLQRLTVLSEDEDVEKLEHSNCWWEGKIYDSVDKLTVS